MSTSTAVPMKRKMIGQTVMVRHRTKINANSGSATMKSCGNNDSNVTTIRAVYMDGSVRVASGDVWKVKPSNDNKADWVTDESSES